MWSAYTVLIRTDHGQNFDINPRAGTFYFNPFHTANGNLSTPMPQECCDYVEALSSETFLNWKVCKVVSKKNFLA